MTLLPLALGALVSCSHRTSQKSPDAGTPSGGDAGVEAPPTAPPDAEAETAPPATEDAAADHIVGPDVTLPPIGSACDTLGAPALGTIEPLFLAADATAAPIVVKRGDGVLITRGAGRLHGRHEKELPYGSYLTSYWEKLSYAFAIEDFTTAGQQHIRLTYLPVYVPDFPTNLRSWKVPGDNATFMQNDSMAVNAASPVPLNGPVGAVHQFDQVTIPASRTLAVGQNFEFEFNVARTGGGGTLLSPYSDTFRYQVGVGGLTPNNLDMPRTPGPLPEARLGGDTTLTWQFAEPRTYFDQMALNTQQENVQRFLEGRRLFYTDFRSGENIEPTPQGIVLPPQPPFPEQADKAGPLFDAAACATCHLRNGAGAPLQGTLGTTSSMVFRLPGDAALGNQLQLQEGSARSAADVTKTVILADGTRVMLRRPTYTVTATGALVALPSSARIARPLIGLGLLEAIDEHDLLARTDFLDCDQDGITGRAALVTEPVTGKVRMGRFGWKSEKASVRHQVADDAAESLGVTTPLIKDAAGKADLNDDDLLRLTTFMRLVGVPPQRNGEDPQVIAGAKVFETVRCASCHVTKAMTSANHPFAELRKQAIKPYTDLLLHDMGPDLMDDSGVPAPTKPGDPPGAMEWRTPPLWGIGLRKTVSGDETSAGLLHDGRAADVLQAILWHGGEATKSKAAFMALSAEDRAALLAFVESL